MGKRQSFQQVLLAKTDSRMYINETRTHPHNRHAHTHTHTHTHTLYGLKT